MIIARIWHVTSQTVSGLGTGKSTRVPTHSAFKNVIRVVVESGLIYTVHSMIILITILTGSTALYPTADSVRTFSSPLPLLEIRRLIVLAVYPNNTDLLPPYHHPHRMGPNLHGGGWGPKRCSWDAVDSVQNYAVFASRF
jgi:hypothetical protein